MRKEWSPSLLTAFGQERAKVSKKIAGSGHETSLHAQEGRPKLCTRNVIH